MNTLQRKPAPAPGHDADALIWEARQRQRRRHLVAGLTVVAVLATAVAAVTGLRSNGHPRPAAPAKAGTRPAPPRPLLPGVNAAVVMWPSAGPASWASGAYVDDLGTGHVALRDLPGIYGCDCDPYVIGTGQRVVYVAWSGLASLPAGLTGKQRWLGPGGFFAPAATPGYLWRYTKTRTTAPGRVSVYQIPAAGGRPGPTITLPRGYWLKAGTDGGLLLSPPDGRDLVLWTPGASPRTLPHSVGYQLAGADARLVAYGTGCHWQISRRAGLAGRLGYDICGTLRVFNTVTRKLTSFSAPVGTAGWEPGYLFDAANPVSPAGTMVAAYAKLPPLRQGRVRLYVLDLTGARHRVRAVPSSVRGLSGANMTWTPSGSWLLYQGPGQHLWAYQPATRKVRTSRTPCCQYIGMLSFPTHPG